MLRQYRHPLRAWLWEVPAGSLEPGESAERAAERELAEEIGGTAGSWRRLGGFALGEAHLTAHNTFLLAQNVVLGERRPELHEVAELRIMPAGDALDLARRPVELPSTRSSLPAGVLSSHSALALLLAEPWLGARTMVQSEH
jgi:8-oxo-dGTP pyrophosphatase MutT (NUDIX family)